MFFGSSVACGSIICGPRCAHTHIKSFLCQRGKFSCLQFQTVYGAPFVKERLPKSQIWSLSPFLGDANKINLPRKKNKKHRFLEHTSRHLNNWAYRARFIHSFYTEAYMILHVATQTNAFNTFFSATKSSYSIYKKSNVFLGRGVTIKS